MVDLTWGFSPREVLGRPEWRRQAMDVRNPHVLRCAQEDHAVRSSAGPYAASSPAQSVPLRESAIKLRWAGA